MARKKTREQIEAEYQAARERAIRIANSLPGEKLTLEQAAALLPVLPEWERINQK